MATNNESKTPKVSVVKIASAATYNGHKMNKAKMVELGLVFKCEQMPKYIKLVPLVGEDIEVIVKLEDEDEKLNLGTFVIKDLAVKQDGEMVLKLVTSADMAEFDNITTLAGNEQQDIKVLFKSIIPDEEETEE